MNRPLVVLAAAAIMALPSASQAAPPRAPAKLLAKVHVTVGQPSFSPRREIRRDVLVLYGVLVFGRPPKAGSLVKFRFYGPGGVLRASRDFRARPDDQGLYARVPRSFYGDRPGRWRLKVTVGSLSKTWRFRIT
jgi:hypothetical protein